MRATVRFVLVCVVSLAGRLALADAIPIGTAYKNFEQWNYGRSWSDAEKSPTNSQDDNMCWAAAAANVLHWTGWGAKAGFSDADQVFAYFQDHWTNEAGLPRYGWQWWFDGTNPSKGWSGWSQVDMPGGQFFPSVQFHDYSYSLLSASTAMADIATALKEGAGVALTVYTIYGGAHAVTCWGYNYEPTNPSLYYGLWITDSDDDRLNATPPDRLRYYEVLFAYNQYYLQDYYGSNDWYIGQVQVLAVPEPGTVLLLAVGGCLLIRRRRR